MEKTEQLQRIISHYWQFPSQEIDWAMEFNSQGLSNFSSLRMLRFLASVEDQFKIEFADVDAIRSFQDLRRIVEGS